MSLPFFHKNHTDISNHLDFPGELLNSPTSSRDCILITGPDLVRWEAVSNQNHTDTYLERLLKGMVVWCTQNRVIQNQDTIHDLHILLHNGALVPLAYRIEEYLATAQLKEQCLRAVLNPYNQVEAIHYQLIRFPFRGYITTSYDTCIETAYRKTQQEQLSKFYQSSLANAINTCRKKQPFVLKLYGDLAEPDSIKLGHRLLTGLYANDVRQQLRQLFFETPAVLIGFNETDEDLTVLQSLVTDGYIVHYKQSSHIRERLDGIGTKSDLPSSSAYIALEFFPENHSPEPVISTQGKDKRPVEDSSPNTTFRPPIFQAATNNSEDHIQDTSIGSSQPSDTLESVGGHGPRPTRTFPSPLACNEQDDLFYNFISLVKKMGYVVEEKTVSGPRGKRCYTHVANSKQDQFRGLIYIPGEILTDRDPNSANVNAVINLWYDFKKLSYLIIFTESQYCSRVIRDAIEQWSQMKGKIVCWNDIEGLKDDKEIEVHRYWVEKTLDMET